MNQPSQYTVKWGHVARTVIYQDSDGEILFTWDASDKGQKRIVLEHHAPEIPRGSKYNIAFERTKQYMESCGFNVEVYP
jgi:hypothetical protein